MGVALRVRRWYDINVYKLWVVVMDFFCSAGGCVTAAAVVVGVGWWWSSVWFVHDCSVGMGGWGEDR